MSRGEQETLLETVKILKIEVHSYKEDNEKLMREQNQINSQVMKILNQLQRKTDNGSKSKHEEEGIYHERRDNDRRDGYSRSVGRTHRHHSPPYSTSKDYASEDSISSLEVSPIRNQRIRHELCKF
jgi:FtsZ-binding cell division protein ZapB